MLNKENEQWVKGLIRKAESDAGILREGIHQHMPKFAVQKLKNAHCHIYASLVYDFACGADRLIGETIVRMDDGFAKSSKLYLAEDFCGRMFNLADKFNEGFALEVNRRVSVLIKVDQFPATTKKETKC